MNKIKITLEELNTLANLMPSMTIIDLIEMVNSNKKRA
ncbi:unknown [Intestinibacter bartlettii CAG:1329]|uniref:Uncharacterized protein n=1 Tax=Intestinibacter bartlettii CAG:1329 TaxID=1263063 RepID=R5XDN4_9FIRM|nr:unknown [Intestinibacter bartlettii CAG:1329]